MLFSFKIQYTSAGPPLYNLFSSGHQYISKADASVPKMHKRNVKDECGEWGVESGEW